MQSVRALGTIIPLHAVPLAIVDSWAVIQGAAACYQFCKSLRQKVEEKKRAYTRTDYARVVKDGQVRQGWRMAIPTRDLIGDSNGKFIRHRVVPLAWTVEEEEYKFAFNSTILIRSVGHLLDGRRMTTLRRFSLLCPEKVNAELLRITYNSDKWSHQYTCYLTSRSVAVLFQKKETNRYRLIITHAFSRKVPQIYDLESPWSDCDAHLVYSDRARRRVCIIFSKWSDHEPEDELANEPTINRFDVGIAAYSLDESCRGKTIHPISCDSLSVTCGDKDAAISLHTLGQMIIFLYHRQEAAQMARHTCVTFDQNGTWQSQNMIYWLQKSKDEYDRFKRGPWHLILMLECFRALRPPKECSKLMSLPLLKYGIPVETRLLGASIFALTNDGLLRRVVAPLPMKYLVAEKLFREKGSKIKEMSRNELMDSLGFDIFEGIPQLSDEEEAAAVIHLEDGQPVGGEESP